jgi:hypothetical protein
MNKNILSIILMLLCVLAAPFAANSADESVLFTANVSPDALIVLDLSGSMAWNPAGGTNIWANSSCTGTFYSSSGSGHTYNCSRLAIAKRAICKMLDDNNDGCLDSNNDGIIDTANITTADESSLKVRIGYMRFYNCANSSSEEGDNGKSVTYSYSSGCNTVIRAINTNNKEIGEGGYGPNYSDIWSSVSGENANGGTPDATALVEAKMYLDAHKATDNASSCRNKFVILITDGADTYACDGNGSENQSDQYKRRRATVDRAKALADAGYKVFVVGFGADMPDFLKHTLNWAAYYGNTDNPNIANTGDTSFYTPYSACSTTPQTNCFKYNCSSGTGITCPTPTLTLCTAGTNNCYCPADSNDPGGYPTLSGGTLSYTGALNGYAYIASSADELVNALKNAISIIASSYSFSTSSMSTARISSENNSYEASFIPGTDPFWKGFLKKYNINSDGSVGSAVWDAGTVLAAKAYSTRNIQTYKGSLTAFTTANISPQDVGKASGDTAGRDLVVNFIQGNPAYNVENWKLGDIWHSNPLVITSPSPYFVDQVDGNNAFDDFRSSHQRTSGSGRVVVTGANDGQFHAFHTSNGDEYFSFIPPNLLAKLQLIAHSSHPTSLTHKFFVDGPITAADVWLGSGTGSSKSSSDWKTLVVFGLGRGVTNCDSSGNGCLWSASSNCTPTSSTAPYGYSLTYTSGYTYCGYYALDLTTTTSPSWKWKLNPTSNQAYFGEPWSQMAIGRVKIAGNEKWVGFIGGGGFTHSSCGGGTPSPPTTTFGKAFFVVDLSNGSILWSYTKATNSDMDYSIPAPPAIVDKDNDGFIDAAYVGDMGGNMWAFDFCGAAASASCGTGNWTGRKLLAQPTGTIRPIYSGAAVSKDTAGNFWVYWGTGDKQCPADSNAQEKFIAVKDAGGSYAFSSLKNITSGTYNPTTDSQQGWYMNFSGSGEKMLSEPTVFGGAVYFTTFTPSSGGSDPCSPGGTSSIYGLDYTKGSGKLSGDVRSQSAGAGIASSPIVSIKPDGSGADLFVNVSGADPHITKLNLSPSMPSNRSNILYWKDRRSN